MLNEMLVQTMIQAMYPGGMAEFDRNFATFITRDNRLVIAAFEGSSLEPKMLEKFEEGVKPLNIELVYTSKANFSKYEDMNEAEHELKEDLSQNLKKFNGRLQFSVNQAMMDIIASDMESDSDDGRELLDAIDDLRGVCNFRIEYKDSTLFTVYLEEDESMGAQLVTGRPDRDLTINKDDQCNLKIALGAAQSVDEFIAMM
jgi:hypothetical protein